MHVTRYIRVWVTQGHEYQAAGIARTFQSLFPSPLFLSWMRCSLWTGKDREGSSLDPGPWAVTEMGSWALGALGTSPGRAASRFSEGLSLVVSLELVLQAPKKYLVPPFLLRVQCWHIRGLELAMVGMLILQRSGNTISHALFCSSEN